jgi:acetoin utilization deacetylase AcuC-like enzyme
MLRWIVSFVVMSTLRVIQNRAVGHITVVDLDLNHGDVTNRPILDKS